MSFLNTVAPLVGRFLLAALFLKSGLGKIGGFEQTLGYMASKGIPLTQLALIVTIILEIGAGALLVIGWRARMAALALFIWMIPVTLLFHNFWAVAPDAKMIQSIMFYKNISIMGGLLLVVGLGSGPLSLKRD